MKIWNYVVMFTGIALLLELGGVSASGFTALFNLLGITLSSTGISNVEVSSTFWEAILGSSGILISITAGIIIGTLTRSSPENYIILPFITGTLYFYGSIILGIVLYALQYESWIAAIGGLLLLPLSVGFYTALVEWWRGTD